MDNINAATTDPNEINEIVNLVCMYYARLSSDDDRYKNSKSKDLNIIAEYFDIKISTVNNIKDYYDALFDNGRKGWWQRTPESYPKLYTTYAKYKEMTTEEHSCIVDSIIEEIISAIKQYFSIKTKEEITVRQVLSK